MPLDMPVQWSSTHTMLSVALKLRAPVTSFCALQRLDLSMGEIQLTTEDWDILWDLESFFAIFVKPTTRLQASYYPTLSAAVSQYLRIMLKL